MVTHLGAFLAMFRLMFSAFVPAFFTDICAKAAQFFSLAATHAHQLSRSIANGRALHVQLNAAYHHFDIIFLCAGRCTMIANSSAAQAGFNARLISMISLHDY
jgi:hypothetical protein